MSRCTGQCCRMIQIAGGRVDVREIRAMAVDAAFKGRDFTEYITIADMLVPLLGDNPHPTRGPAFLTEIDHAYTCKHFNGRDCMIHETKPRMCRDYPYGHGCHEEGCTLVSIGGNGG